MDTTRIPSYRSACIDRRTPNIDQGYLIYHTLLGSFDQSTDVAWSIIKHLIEGIDALVNPANIYEGEIGPLVRAEFFWDKGLPQHRGVVLYDNKGQAVMHVLHALLGYGGAGPALSGQILEALGVPEEVFEEANNAVPHQDYVLVFSREQVINDTVMLYGTPRETWEWWRVR